MPRILARCPLSEMRQRALQLSRCNVEGFRLPGAPWAFQLAWNSGHAEAPPLLKTVGFQRVCSLGIDFLVRRNPGSLSESRFPGSFCWVEGTYPPATGGLCEQWRGEGVAEEIDISEVRATAPLRSFAQILACHTCSAVDSGARAHAAGGGGEGGRAPLRDLNAFVSEVRALNTKLEAGSVPDSEIKGAVQAFRLRPSRVELLRSGPEIWERFEWQQTSGTGPDAAMHWHGPRELMPY